MPLRIGVSCQQYQCLEARGNPRLDTLDLIAKGLNSEIILIPSEKLSAVIAVLNGELTVHPTQNPYKEDKPQISDDPWAMTHDHRPR